MPISLSPLINEMKSVISYKYNKNKNNIMVKESDESKDYFDKRCGDRDKELVVGVEGRQIRSVGGTSGEYTDNPIMLAVTSEIMGLTIGTATNVTG